jgi:hypothetical protein
MRIARLVGLAIGIICLVGLGLASFSRAQQTKETTGRPGHSKSEVRERLLQLRTDVEVLQLEYDANRATLLAWLTGSATADLTGTDLDAHLKNMRDMSAYFTRSSEESKGEEPQNKREPLKAVLKQKKDEFAATVRRLNEKKLDLAEAERVYQREAQ